MKKSFMMLAASAVMFFTSCEDDEKVIAADKLPQAAQTFIDTHFTDTEVTRVVKDTEGKTEYDVRLSNGFKIEFNGSGTWREVEGYGAELPASFLAELPDDLIAYVNSNHATQALSKVDLNKTRYEVELTGGLEIIFSLEGAFLRYDE